MLQFLRFRVLFAVAAVLFAMGAAYSALHTTQGVHGAINDPPLSPADYRGPIVDVEAILFSPAPLHMEERVRLGAALDVVRRELQSRGGTDLSRYSSRELGTLAGMARGLGPLDGAALERVRENWMRIRSNTFDDVAWYRYSEADPVASREEQKLVLSDGERIALAQLEESLVQIEGMIERGRRDCERLGEPGSDASWHQSAGPAFAQAWQDWAVNWQQELTNVRRWLPAEPAPDTWPGLRHTRGGAEGALRQLEQVPRDGSGRWRTPTRHNWERRFQDAERQVRNTRLWMDRAQQGLGI